MRSAKTCQLILISAWAPLFWNAAAAAPPPGPSPQQAQEINAINARQFDVKITRLSVSGQVALLENRSAFPSPRENQILLLKNNEQPVIAVRVIKALQDSDRFIAKVLKRYEAAQSAPPTAETLTAFEKVSDKAPPPATSQDTVDIQELEQAFQPEPLLAPEAVASIARPEMHPEMHQKMQSIASLKLDTENIRVRPVLREGVPMGLAELRGNFNRQDVALLYNTKYRVFPDAKGDFLIHLPIQAAETTLRFSLDAVSAYGTVEHEEVRVRLPEWAAWHKTLSTAPVLPASDRKPFLFSAGLGITHQAYTETGAAPFQQFALTPKFAAFYSLVPQKWDLGINLFFTALPFGSNNSSVLFRALGTNARVGYRLPPGFLGLSPSWQLRILLGAYYTTTFASPRLFGYQHAAGPQIFPVVSRSFPDGSTGSFYFKYSPVSNGLSFFTLANAEVAAGLSVQPRRLAFASHPLSLTLDYARLTLHLANGGSIQSSSWTLGAALEF